MTNKQRKQALELLYINPLVAFLPPNPNSWLPDNWLCESCNEYSPVFNFGKIRLYSEPKMLTWDYSRYKDDPHPVEINASTGEVIRGHARLDEFHEYLKSELDKHYGLVTNLKDQLEGIND